MNKATLQTEAFPSTKKPLIAPKESVRTAAKGTRPNAQKSENHAFNPSIIINA